MKWFLGFLLANTVTFTYASITLHQHFLTLRSTVQSAQYGGGGGIHLWLYLFRIDVFLGALFLFVVLCDAMVTAFLVYHAYLVFSGVTTNETLKFADVKEAIHAGEVSLYADGQGKFVLGIAGGPDPIPWTDLENVYDCGWKTNFARVLHGA